MTPLMERVVAAARTVAPVISGQVSRVVGLRFDVAGLDLPVGATVRVEGGLEGEVIACATGEVTCMA